MTGMGKKLVLLATKQWCMVEQGREEAMTMTKNIEYASMLKNAEC
jgi:hypothetical protein